MTEIEKDRMIEALTAVTANQHIEIIRCHERINELLRFNNQYEDRYRMAARKSKELEDRLEEIASAAEDGRFD